MSENKTKPTHDDVMAFLNAVEPEKKRQDSFEILHLMEEVTGEPPQMWGDSIIGFGSYHYKYASGREGDWMLVGFSPRKQAISLYLSYGYENFEDLMSKLGKYKTGKACLYVKKLEDVDQDVLRELVKRSAEHMKEANS